MLSVKALFTAMWLATIGLANAKLLDYQKEWSVETWLILGGAYVAFHAGALIGGQWSDRLLEPFQKHTRIGKRIHISFDSNRLFGICLGVSLFGIACFCANVLIRGYIPFFVSDDYLVLFLLYALLCSCGRVDCGFRSVLLYDQDTAYLPTEEGNSVCVHCA